MPHTPLVPVVACIVLACASALAAAPAEDAPDPSRVDAANAAYEAGNFPEAEKLYTAIAREGHYSPELFYNIANANYRMGLPGPAALWYHRALALVPGMPEARQNLRVIEDQTGALVVETEGLSAWIAKVPPALFIVLSTAGFWLAAIAIAIAVFSPRCRPWLPSLLIAATLCLVLALAARYATGIWRGKLASQNYAVVTTDGTSALVNAVPDAEPVIELPPGSVVRILEKRGPWRFIAIPGNLRGWLHSENHAAVWPPFAASP